MSERLPRVICITGSIGSGKSSVGEILKQRGVCVIDADDLARRALLPGSQATKAIAERFGSDVLAPSGEIDRIKLARLVFSDKTLRVALEQIVHPQIRALFVAELTAHQARSPGPLVYLIPLLFEAADPPPGMVAAVTVWAPDSLCISRASERSRLSSEEAAQRLAAQLPGIEKIRRSEYVIRNDGSKELLERQVIDLIRRYDMV